MEEYTYLAPMMYMDFFNLYLVPLDITPVETEWLTSQTANYLLDPDFR